MRNSILALSLLFTLIAQAQFDPSAGQAGSLAVHKDSSAIQEWAHDCEVTRGYQNIANTGLGYASAGSPSMAVGSSDAGVVSLGDGGSAILTFGYGIMNGPGADFAVFENSFSDTFLELAFVEVSTDGVNYFRFQAISNTQNTVQTDGFGSTDATKIYNLAGKYKAQYGTPFDLEELKNEVGLDVDNINFIKVIDVIGNIDNTYASNDKNNNKINDPWPTPYASSGFDLEAVGVINMKPDGVKENEFFSFSVYPNPASAELVVDVKDAEPYVITVLDMKGQVLVEYSGRGLSRINVCGFEEGIYLLKISSFNKIHVGKFSKM